MALPVKMRAAQLVAPRQIRCETVDLGVPEEGTVVLRTRLAAICGSDLHEVFDEQGADAYPRQPGIPGHESVGEVIEPGSSRFSRGDMVLSLPDKTRARAFAEYQVLPPRFVLPVPAWSDPARIVLAQQLGTVVFAMKQFWSGPPGTHATVIGAGSSGLLFLQVLRSIGFEHVVVSDIDPNRLSLARAMGADVAVDARSGSVTDVTLDVSDGRGADLVVEAVGSDRTRVQALESVAEGGLVGLFGLGSGGPSARELPQVDEPSARIRTSNNAQLEPGLASFRRALSLILRGEVDVRGLLTHRFPLKDVAQAFATAKSHSAGAIKVGITFEQ